MRQLSQRALQAFMTTFRVGSISGASEALNLTQPAISRSIKDLELALGFPLFHRIRGRLSRTPEGVAFYGEVSRSFIALERLQVVAENIRQGHRFRLTVNALPGFASTYLPKILAEFLADNPDTILTAQPLTTDEVLRRVRDHECNFGIVETRVFPVGIRTLHVHEGPAMCILPEGHRLSDHEVIEPKDLDGEVFIQMIAAAQLGELTARLLAERKIKCRSIIECRLAYLAQKLVMEGVGISIIDPLTAQLHAEQGGVVRPFLPRLVNSISFIARDDSVLTQIEQRFVDKSVAYLSAMEGAPMRRVRPDRIATDPPGP